MNWKGWLNDNRGGTGLVIGLMVVVFVGLLYVDSIWYADAAPRRSEDELVAIAKKLRREDSLAQVQKLTMVVTPVVAKTPIKESVIQMEQDSLAALAAATPPTPKVKPKTKPTFKPKAKPKPKPRTISAEEMVRSRLREGKSVGKIARETGLKRKFIREIKRRKDCNCRK